LNFWVPLASGFGIGYAPVAPGTFGSLAGLVLGVLILLAAGHLALLITILILIAAGVYAISTVPAAGDDPGWIVIDEIAGQMIPLLVLAGIGWFNLLAAFVLFRLFDIFKPGPIAWADARHDAYGVMGDDIIAGLFAAIILLLAQAFLQSVTR
jgi:phosphatidylglycerophosphatase A